MNGFNNTQAGFRPDDNITVQFSDSGGGGFANKVVIPRGTSVGFFLQQQGANTTNKIINLNGQVPARNDILKDGDNLSLTPANVKGA